jgi:hypothetical protein
MGQDLASTRQTRQHSPSHVVRTRQTRRHSPKAIFEKNVTRLDTFARVICHFHEFGASGHCLKNSQNYSEHGLWQIPTNSKFLTFKLNIFYLSDVNPGHAAIAYGSIKILTDA